MAWYPKAIRKVVTKHRTAISGPNRVINHIAVSNSDSLFGFFNSSSVQVCSHFYVRFDGTVEQYVDTKYRAPANLEANSDSISIETAGGVTNANTSKWTTAQVNSLIQLNRWICDTHSIPKVLLPDSKAGRRGIGYHRLGIDPWRVSGGQKWSNARGKICPGQGKIDQMPAIVSAVAKGDTDMPLTDADVKKIWDYAISKIDPSSGSQSSMRAERYLAYIHHYVLDARKDAASAKNALLNPIILPDGRDRSLRWLVLWAYQHSGKGREEIQELMSSSAVDLDEIKQILVALADSNEGLDTEAVLAKIAEHHNDHKQLLEAAAAERLALVETLADVVREELTDVTGVDGEEVASRVVAKIAEKLAGVDSGN